MDEDKPSIMSTLEEDEMIDFDLGEEDAYDDDGEGLLRMDKSLFTIDSLFIVVYEEDGNMVDKLLLVRELIDENNSVQFKDENDNDESLSFNRMNQLILSNESYSIIDIEKVEEFSEDIDDIELTPTNEMYPEIDIIVEEVKDKKYSLQEKKENLLNELISLFKAYGDDVLLFQISDMVDQLMKMYVLYDTLPYDDSDTLDFIKNIINQKSFHLPKWLVPIIDNRKRLYIEDEGDEGLEGVDESNDTFVRSFKDELIAKYNLLDSLEDKNYRKVMELVYSYSPFQNKNTVLLPHSGMYLRDCSHDSPGNGLNGLLTFDMNRTREELIFPRLKDHDTSFETIIPKEQLSLAGMYALSHYYLDITLVPRNLSLHELYFLSDSKYSYLLFKNRIKENEATQHIINRESLKESDNLKTNNNAYMLQDKNCSFEELGVILKNNLPGYTEIIDSLPKIIQSQIYNYTDFKKAYLCYDIEYSDLDIQNRGRVNALIQKNIQTYVRNYNRSVKRKVIKTLKKQKLILSVKEKINLSKAFIMGIPVIPVRNNYLKKFMNTFSREPKMTENQNFFYEKNSTDKLLCKHHLYSINIHKDPNAFDALKSIYGGEVEDGFISCKICREYICSENFSILEGFSDGVPTTSKDILDTSADELKELTEKQTRIKKRIRKISSLFGVDLNIYDKQQIIDYYDLFNNGNMIDGRYDMKKAFESHPRVEVVKKSYKFVKPAKTQKDKVNNKKNKELMTNELSSLKEYFLDCNEIFIDIFFILFIIQTSTPSYPVNSKISINLWDFDPKDTWEDIQQNPNIRLSMKTIEIVTVLIQKIIRFNRKDAFWLNIQELLAESSKYDDIPSFNQQFVSVSAYILQNNTIKEKLKDYFLFKMKNQSSLYVKEDWATYKPFRDNKIVLSMNEITNQELKTIKNSLLKVGGEYSYSNLSSIRTFEEASQTPRFKQLKIPFSEIMKNESYERLFKYSLQLHGKSKQIPMINLLINRFNQTIKDEKVKGLLSKIGWSDSFKKVNRIDYNEFRTLFASELIQYFQEKDPNEKDTLKIYFHFHINNWNGMLLNGHPKREYSYVPPVIFPDESYETLLSGEGEGDDNFIDNLFARFCSDSDGNITERYSNDAFITNIIADPTVEREAVCENRLAKTKENFYRILEYKRNKTKLPIDKSDDNDLSIESRIKYFIRNNNYLERDADELFPLFRKLAYDNRCCSENELRTVFNEISKYNSYLINKIQTFFINRKGEIKDEQYNRFKSNFGRSIESLSVLLNKLLEETDKLPQMITNILQIISRLSTGDSLNENIPKQWKASDTNISNLQEFLENNEFLQHYSIFVPLKKKTMEGYYQYQKEKNHKLCFQGLFTYLKRYFKKDIHTIIGNNNSKMIKEYTDIFNRYNLLFLFSLMIEYIEDLQDEESPSSTQANLLFSALEEQEQLERRDSIILCSSLSFDLMIDIMEEYTDSNWIHQTNLLSDKLSRQKEREKQEIIDTLESKTSDSRLVMVQHQNCGLSNYFHGATKKNLSHIKTDEYKNKLTDERSQIAKEFFSDNETEIEVMEGIGIDTSLLQPGVPGIEEEEEVGEAYSQNDQDREDEGDDDGDDDGDYREN